MLPEIERRHAAIGKVQQRLMQSSATGRNNTGIIMTMNLVETAHQDAGQPRLLCSYENGSVTMWGYTQRDREISIEGIGWESVWTVKKHVESGMLRAMECDFLADRSSVMALTLSRDASFALTVSADHLVCRYIISVRTRSLAGPPTRDLIYCRRAPKNRGNTRICSPPTPQ